MKNQNILKFIPVGMLSLVTLAGAAILGASGAVADSHVSTLTIDVPEACSMSTNNSNRNEDDEYVISASITPGLWIADLATYTTSVTCNDQSGYSVYAVGYGRDTLGDTNLVGVSSDEVIPTGLDMTTSTSNWMFKLTPVSGTYAPTAWPNGETGNASGYHTIPSTQTKVITFTDGVNVNSLSQYQVTYGVATTGSQRSDTYTGKVKYTLVHPNFADSDGNIGD